MAERACTLRRPTCCVSSSTLPVRRRRPTRADGIPNASHRRRSASLLPPTQHAYFEQEPRDPLNELPTFFRSLHLSLGRHCLFADHHPHTLVERDSETTSLQAQSSSTLSPCALICQRQPRRSPPGAHQTRRVHRKQSRRHARLNPSIQSGATRTHGKTLPMQARRPRRPLQSPRKNNLRMTEMSPQRSRTGLLRPRRLARSTS